MLLQCRQLHTALVFQKAVSSYSEQSALRIYLYSYPQCLLLYCQKSGQNRPLPADSKDLQSNVPDISVEYPIKYQKYQVCHLPTSQHK